MEALSYASSHPLFRYQEPGFIIHRNGYCGRILRLVNRGQIRQGYRLSNLLLRCQGPTSVCALCLAFILRLHSTIRSLLADHVAGSEHRSVKKEEEGAQQRS